MEAKISTNSIKRGQKRSCAEMDYKLFNDSVLGLMSFHPLVVVVMDTRQVQRLRHIKQLGTCYYVFPGASHNRFEHSLGTAFIAGKLFDSLRQKRLPSDVVSDSQWEKQKLCAQVAALCHDIGHGPFSHAWENFKRRLGEDWTVNTNSLEDRTGERMHDTESVKLFEDLLMEEVSPSRKFGGKHLKTVRDVFKFYELTEDDIETIKKMIVGQEKENNYLFQVVCNKINEIDVDKWEYITRDSAMLNIPVGFDFNRLINFSCIVQNEVGEEQICFRDKECSQLLEMFLSRGKLHDIAYKHTKVKIIEEMLLDAFVLANDRLKLSSTPIVELTDHVYQRILYEHCGQEKEMRKAKEILRRIESRHLYKCVAQEAFEGKIPDLNEIKTALRDIEGIDKYIEGLGMTTVTVDMTGPNRERPLKNVCVYSKQNGGQKVSQAFDWDAHQNSLKPHLTRMKRSQILLLYKEKDAFPEALIDPVAKRLQQFLKDRCVVD